MTAKDLLTALNDIDPKLLEDPLDVEECVNDAYLALWQGIPPAKPAPLLPYALRVVRNLCLKRYHWNIAQKRNSQFDLAYSELESCLADHTGPEQQQDAKELRACDGGERVLDVEQSGNAKVDVRRMAWRRGVVGRNGGHRAAHHYVERAAGGIGHNMLRLHICDGAAKSICA